MQGGNLPRALSDDLYDRAWIGPFTRFVVLALPIVTTPSSRLNAGYAVRMGAVATKLLHFTDFHRLPIAQIADGFSEARIRRN